MNSEKYVICQIPSSCSKLATKKTEINYNNTSSKGYQIPQIDPKYEGIKKSAYLYEQTKPASPFIGSRVKDKVLMYDNTNKVDTIKAYDSFRPDGEKKRKDGFIATGYNFKEVNKDALERIYNYKEEDFESEEEEIEQESKIDLGIDDSDEDDSIYYGDNFEESSIKAVEREEFNKEIEEEPSINTASTKLDVESSVDLEIEDDFSDLEEVEDDFSDLKAEETTISLEEYTLPPLDIFETSDSLDEETPEWVITKKDIINEVLEQFGVSGEVINYTVGPSFTRYEVSLQSGVKVKAVNDLNLNLQMQLQAKSLRILSPIPGKMAVGIEVPNDERKTVYFGDTIDEDFINDGKPLRVALGKNIDNEVIYRKIDDMPHGLIAGSTKSGKSVCINTILVSLLLKNTPKELRLLLVDPKKVELSFYEGLPHLITPVISDSDVASQALKWAVEEMERRYDILFKTHARDIDRYNEARKKNPNLEPLPYIVIVIDEFADLMATSSSEVEEYIQRLTQKARAAGMHLLLATQRPDVKVISGNIKSNIPARIAFRVASYIDSQTILDETGAENLLGRGDMLIKDGDIPERVQGSYISDEEINDVCDYIRAEAEPEYLFTHEDLKRKIKEGMESTSSNETENFLYEVACYCVNNKVGSTNKILGVFNLGYNRASRIINILVERGVLDSRVQGSLGREVLIDNIEDLDNLFNR